MHVWNKSTRVWDGYTALFFAVFVCSICWTLHFAASFGTDFTITVPSIQFAFDTKSCLVMAATFLPAAYCFVNYPECRSSLRKVRAGWMVYALAILTGFALPFTSYLGTHYFNFPWGHKVAGHLAKVFAWNLFLTPLWEEIVWRGCFLKKVRSFSSAPSGILVMSVGWTIWHGGYIVFLYSSGIPIHVLKVAPFTYFCVGIILGSVFEMAGESLWPCVLLHTAFNAATAVYYEPFNRTSELGSYVSELIFTAVAATIFFSVVRRQKSSNPLINSPDP